MRLAVLEDEQVFRDPLVRLLLEYENVEITEFTSGEELMLAYGSGIDFDILFLDIEMEGENGIEVAGRIRDFDQKVIIVFVTNYINYSPEAFKIDAFRYLLKSLSDDEMREEFKAIFEKYNRNKFKLSVKNKDSLVAVELDDIRYFESFGRKVSVHCVNFTYEYSQKISSLAQDLLYLDFIQCHKSIVVNMNYIKRISYENIELHDGIVLPIGRKKRPEVMSAFRKFVTGR